MANQFRELIARNLKRPETGLGGLFVKMFFKIRNKPLEQTAVRFCKIEPHHNVLEVGFGPGIGLKAAFECVKDGTGKIFGVDLSSEMVREASKSLTDEIEKGKVEICHGDVTNLPFKDDMFDKVFHCNCYYFWPDMRKATEELYRVMRENSHIVAVLNLERLIQVQSKGFMKYGNIDPDPYMKNLELAGFENVSLNHHTGKSGKKFETITADIIKKKT